MNRLFVITIILALAMSGCKFFENRKLFSKGDKVLAEKQRIEDSIHRADSLAKVKANMIKKQREKARQDSLKMVEELRNKRFYYKYQIIAGSFKTAKYAQDYQAVMQDKGYDAIIIPGKYEFNLVSIIGYPEWKQAVNEINKLRGDAPEGVEYWIYVRPEK